MKTCTLTIVAVLLSAAAALAADKARSPDDAPAKLIELLKSDAPPAEKAITCKKLAIYGNQDAVPALAPLLADAQLASWARIALEAIPGPAADDALRAVLDKVQGRLLVGVINSIGVRRDAKAIAPLSQRLKDADAEVASAAAVALGRIGGASAVAALEPALATAPAAARSAVAAGCILAAEGLLADGKATEAAKLYDTVRKADVPAQRVLEATRGAILARGAAGLPLLVEQLQSPDKGRFTLGLSVARELPGREVSQALLTELKQAAPQRQSLLLVALADRGEKAALPAVLQAAKNGADEARVAAVQVLGRLGDASCVPVLLEAAMADNGELAQAALDVLTDLPGQDIDRDLAERLAKADGKARLLLIQLAGRRHMTSSLAALRKAADDTDAQVRAAAITALGFTVDLDDLPVLIARVAAGQNADDMAAAAKALAIACQRMPDQAACVAKLTAAMSQSPIAVKCRFLEILGTLGGPQALAAVAAAAKDSNAELQDAGSRLLGGWMSVEAAPVLLDLAKTSSEEKYKIRALRGYIRLARQFDMPEADRAAMCRTALQTAQREAEKKLVLDVVARYPSPEMLTLALEAAKMPGLKDEAAQAVLVIAQKVGGRSAEVRKLLEEIGKGPVKLEIIKAEYGADKKFKDVTAVLQKHARDFPIIVLPSSNYNGCFGGDPAPGVVKQLKIQYRMNGKLGEASFAENAAIALPMPK